MKQYETVIGLEVHVELATKTKIFCGCSTEFGGAPNTHTCPVCTGMPGSLPVLNRQVVEFVDHGNVNVLGAGLAVAAVGALALVGMQGRGSDDGGVVLFLVGGGFVLDGFVYLGFGIIAAQDLCRGGPGEGVVNALHRTQAHAERRTLFVKQSAAGEALHDCDADVIFFTDAV